MRRRHIVQLAAASLAAPALTARAQARKLSPLRGFYKFLLAERRVNARGQLIAMSEATVKLDVAGRRAMEVGEGNGPVNALDAALRKALIPVYPELEDMRLVDFKVRILDSAGGTAATTRVMIESADAKGRRWSTIGVSPNIVDASYNALYDAITYKLFRDGAQPAQRT